MGKGDFRLVGDTIESVNSIVYLSKEQCSMLSKLYSIGENVIEEEKGYYHTIEEDLRRKFNESVVQDIISRRICVAYSPDIDSNIACGTSFHLLLNRGEENTLMIYQRSMSNRFFISDIIFYSKLASDYDCALSITIGSLHFII